jgi:hypothetical protein
MTILVIWGPNTPIKWQRVIPLASFTKNAGKSEALWRVIYQ